MRSVSIRELYRSLSKELMDLPFEITKGGVRVGYVVEGLDKPDISLDTFGVTPAQSGKSLDNIIKSAEKGLDNNKVFNPRPKVSG